MRGSRYVKIKNIYIKTLESQNKRVYLLVISINIKIILNIKEGKDLRNFLRRKSRGEIILRRSLLNIITFRNNLPTLQFE